VAKQHYVVVVADDDPLINLLITILLEGEGYEVLSCTTGAEALQVVARVKPDLVITDLRMETDDAGLQLLAQLRADPMTTGIGVIICSADGWALARNVGIPADRRVSGSS
jgi:two-component system response regulator GlrR